MAALNLYPFFGHGRSIANSFLVILTLLTLLEILLPLPRRSGVPVHRQPAEWVPALFCMPIAAYWALSSGGLASPSPDLTSCLLLLVCYVICGQALGGYARMGAVLPRFALVLSILAATAVTVKMSNAAWCAVIMCFALAGALHRSARPVRSATCLLLLPSAIVLVWALRGFILSGAPLFPSLIGYMNVDWAVSPDEVIDTANWVYSWARQPNKHWSMVLGSWSWFSPWLERIWRDDMGIVYPVRVFLALGAADLVAIAWYRRMECRGRVYAAWLLLLPVAAGIVFWFFTAPDPRFSNGVFLLLPVTAITIFLTHARLQSSRLIFSAVVCALFVIGNYNLLNWAYKNRRQLQEVSTSGWQAVRPAPVREKVMRTGCRVLVPVADELCWDAPLPCTPFYKKENLRMRNPHDLSAGFTMRAGPRE